MGDMSEDFRALKEARQERHAKWHKYNREIINTACVSYVDKGETLLFRENIKADFYPSTGRWRSNNKTYSGGAIKFLAWLQKHDEKQ